MVNKENLSWLTTVPCSDQNFKIRLAESDIDTCKQALKCETLTKGSRKAIESRIKKVEKNG